MIQWILFNWSMQAVLHATLCSSVSDQVHSPELPASCNVACKLPDQAPPADYSNHLEMLHRVLDQF